MATGPEIAIDFSPFVRVYKDGRVERLMGNDAVPAGADEAAGVDSKDVVVSPETGLSVRIYVPKISSGAGAVRTPVVVFFHGGGFVIGRAASAGYHNYLNSLVAGARVAAVSVEYRRAPEHPLPAAYDDSWAALKWVAAHSGGNGPDPWLNERADPARIFLAGDSAGANIAHRVGVWAGGEDPGRAGIRIEGIVLIHPYFLGEGAVAGEEGEPEATRAFLAGLWRLGYPKTVGLDDPWINPEKDPDFKKLGCGKVLVCVAGNDPLRHRGRHYYEVVKTSGWVGSVEIFESDGEDHVFFLYKDPTAENCVALQKKISSFINQD